MNKTDIEWCDMTWNPVTGCLHGCEYCYARGIAKRFKSDGNAELLRGKDSDYGPCRVSLDNKPFPSGFAPTLYPDRLGEPAKKKQPQNIFVCSMADLFGEWVPDEWIREVFNACEAAPQHRYLFLTKNPARYLDLAEKDLLPNCDNMWFGSTSTTPDAKFWRNNRHNTFVSVEPIMASFDQPGVPVKKVDWIIIGAETGNRKGKIIPERRWIETIVSDCEATGVPVFMKDSLAGIWEAPLIREFPWGGRHNNQD